jgi:hypothetical protein
MTTETDPDILAMNIRSETAVNQIIEHAQQFDQALMTWEELVARIRGIVTKAVEQTYDDAFMRGLEEAELGDEPDDDSDYEIDMEDGEDA